MIAIPLKNTKVYHRIFNATGFISLNFVFFFSFYLLNALTC